MASAAIKALEILFLILLPGACVVSAAIARKKISCLEGRSEFLFLSVAISFAASSVFGLILAYLGVFSIPGLCLILAVLSIPFFFLARSAPKTPFLLLRRGKSAAVPLLLVLILAGILFFRPVEYIFGGWDPGVYVNSAVHLARTGALTVSDPWAEAPAPDDRLAISHQHKHGFLERYPGFRYGPPGSRILSPQFYHLWTVWLACAYGLLGLHGMFYLTPFLGLLSLISIYFLGRELWDKSAALLAVLILSLNIVEIWQARLPTSEILAQFLVFSGVFSFARYLRLEEKFWALTAGLILGVFLLSQISAALILIPLAVFFYCRWFLSFRKSDLSFSWPFFPLLLLSLSHHLLFGKTYVASILPPWMKDNPSLLSYPIVAMIALAAARLLPLALRQRLAQSAQGKNARIAAAAVLAALLWFACFIRPYLNPADQDAANLVEFGWLVSPLGLALASLGLLREVYRNRKPAAGFLLLLVIAFAGNFLWRQLIHQHYLWAARRFAVVAVPGAVLLASRLLTDFPRGRAAGWRLVFPVAVVLLVFSTARMSQVIWRHDEYRGAVDFCDRLSRCMGEGSVAVVWSDGFTDKLPTPLHLTYGHAIAPIYRSEPDAFLLPGAISRIMASSSAFSQLSMSDLSPYILLTDRTPPEVPGLSFELAEEYPYHCGLLERRIDRLPREIDPDAPDGNFTVRLYRVPPDRPAK